MDLEKAEEAEIKLPATAGSSKKQESSRKKEICFCFIYCDKCFDCVAKVDKVKLLSRVQLFVTPWTVAYQAPLSMGFSRQEYWSGLPFPSPGGIFPTQGSNPSPSHCRQTLYRLSHQGSPEKLKAKEKMKDIPT